MTDKLVVLVTCRTAKECERIARALVQARLVACGNILQTPVKSVYRWREKIETTKEFLLLLKTSRRRFAELQAAIKKLHSYEVPEIIALPVKEGSISYLAWISESVTVRGKR